MRGIILTSIICSEQAVKTYQVCSLKISYRVIQPKCETPEPTYFLYTWINPKTIWRGKSHSMLVKFGVSYGMIDGQVTL